MATGIELDYEHVFDDVGTGIILKQGMQNFVGPVRIAHGLTVQSGDFDFWQSKPMAGIQLPAAEGLIGVESGLGLRSASWDEATDETQLFSETGLQYLYAFGSWRTGVIGSIAIPLNNDEADNENTALFMILKAW